jgi:ribosomal protein S27E
MARIMSIPSKELRSLEGMERRINERIKELEGDPTALYEYLARCAPHIREYATERPGGIKRKDIFDEYMIEIEGAPGESRRTSSFDMPLQCPGCEKWHTMIYEHETSDMVCTECGCIQYIQCNERGFKEEQEMDRNVVYSYKRENHFNEWVAQFQAKESTTVPDEVIVQLRHEFKKQRIKNAAEITHTKVRALLKKLDMNKYYEHAPYITTILNGVKPPTMPQPLEDKLRLMFGQIQKPFEKHCPADRKNFLSYSFTLYKFCELLGEDEYLPCFPLLKSKEKLHRQDDIWKLITRELNWEFIPTAA